MARMSEEELFAEYREGNDIAMEILINKVGAPLFRTIFRRVGDRATAEDIFQDTLERIVRHRDKFDPAQTFRGWAWSIALHRCSDFMRKKYREKHAAENIYETGHIVDPEQTMSGMEKMANFTEALESLPVEQREVFFLREEAQLSFKKIGEITGRPLGTVLTQMRAALKKLGRAVEG